MSIPLKKAAPLVLFLTAAAHSAFAAEQPVPFATPQVPPTVAAACSAPEAYPFLTLAQAEAGPPAAPSSEPAAPAAAAQHAQPEWKWRRASALEYTGIGLVTAATLASEAKFKPKNPRWTTNNGFDDTFRDLLRLNDRGARRTVYSVSDALMAIMIAAPEIDSFVTLGLRDRHWDATWQTNAINLESFAFTSFVSSVLQNSIARERPFVRDCSANGDCDFGMANRSMPSGHTAFAFTGAGLICTHHRYQALYLNPAADSAACYTGLGIASADGLLRIMADSHYASDVLAGAAIGLFSGFVLPRLLHYSKPLAFHSESSDANSAVKSFTVSPQLVTGGGGVGIDLTF